MTLKRNILVFHAAALGDIVVTFPLLLGLSRLHPQSRVILITHASHGKLAERLLGVESDDANAWHSLHGTPALAPPQAKRLAGASQMVYFSVQRDEPFEAACLAAAGDIPILHLKPRPAASGVSVGEFHLQQLAGNPALQQTVVQMRMYVQNTGLAPRAAGSAITLHVGAGSANKRWPLERFIALAARLRSDGEVTFALGEVEREQLGTAELATLAGAGSLAEPADPASLAEQLKQTRLYVGNDTGPTHLAASLGVATIALFGGASDAAVWSPIGPRVQVISASTLDAISVDDVATAVERAFE